MWIENIPYDETREYVQRILWHRLMFSWLGDESRGEQAGFSLAPITALRSTPNRTCASRARNNEQRPAPARHTASMSDHGVRLANKSGSH